MKYLKILILYFLMVGQSLTIKAQQIDQRPDRWFVNAANQWNVRYDDQTSPNISTFKYTFSEDSVLIGDRHYFEMLESNVESEDNWKGMGIFFREDSNKVYLYHQGSESLFYDFNMDFPDEFAFEITLHEVITLWVSTNETIILADSLPRRKLTLHCHNDIHNSPITWVEGIGDLNLGPLGVGLVCSSYGGKLLCFYQNGEMIYESDDEGCWITPVNVIDLRHEVKIYPNPGRSRLWIDASMNFVNASVFNLMGNELLSVNEPTMGIDISKLSSGFFILRLTEMTGTYVVLTFSKI